MKHLRLLLLRLRLFFFGVPDDWYKDQPCTQCPAVGLHRCIIYPQEQEGMHKTIAYVREKFFSSASDYDFACDRLNKYICTLEREHRKMREGLREIQTLHLSKSTEPNALVSSTQYMMANMTFRILSEITIV